MLSEKNKIQHYIPCKATSLYEKKNSSDKLGFKNTLFSVFSIFLFNMHFNIFNTRKISCFYLKHLQMHCIVFKTFLSKAKPCAWKDLWNTISIINTSNYFIHYHLGYKCRESSTYVTKQLKHIGGSSRAFSASTLILPLAPFRNHGCSWHLWIDCPYKPVAAERMLWLFLIFGGWPKPSYFSPNESIKKESFIKICLFCFQQRTNS